MKEECSVKSTNKIITFEENRSKLTVRNNNQKETIKVTVDGCQITTGLRCDYLLLANDVEHFIELKGQDLNHAVKQLIGTIKQLSSNVKTQNKISFIICTRSPLSAASIQNLRLKFKRDFSCDLIVKNSPYSYSLK